MISWCFLIAQLLEDIETNYSRSKLSQYRPTSSFQIVFVISGMHSSDTEVEREASTLCLKKFPPFNCL